MKDKKCDYCARSAGHSRLSDMHSPNHVAVVDALRKQVKAEGLYAASYSYREAVGDLLREAWAKSRGLTRITGHRCLTSLAGKRCKPWDCQGTKEMPHGVMDHVRAWRKGGKLQLITAEPYNGIRVSDMRQLIEFADLRGVDVRVTAGSFYFPGLTLLIEFEKAAAPAPHSDEEKDK